jgi:hypothetical protein
VIEMLFFFNDFYCRIVITEALTNKFTLDCVDVIAGLVVDKTIRFHIPPFSKGLARDAVPSSLRNNRPHEIYRYEPMFAHY